MTSGSVATGALTASSGAFSSNVGVAGNITSGSSATGNHTVTGTIYLNGYPVLITSAGQPVPQGHRTLYLQP